VIDRRSFVVALTGGLFGLPSITGAQQARKIPIVAFLSSGSGETLDQFRVAMHELGYVEGKNVVLELRLASGKPEALPGLAIELVRLNVDVLYATGPPALRAARDATSVIPIVALDLETDPVQSGLVRSLARPGGNITGLFLDLPTLAGKWLELLEAAAPGRHRIGLLWDSTTGSSQLDAAKAAAGRFDLDLRIVEVHNSDDMDEALRNAVSKGARAMVMLSSPTVSASSKQLAEFMIRNRLPAISPFRAFADGGGLLSYGPNLTVFRRVAASYVDSILKGAKPSELPIHQPTTFELVINLQTAKTLGLTIPQSLLLRADEVIQ
jgi:putative ABC transport system substrate-binding protein